ncbi:MAG: choice-of-anchor O protein [Thioalkalispiraceae bacterium]|jgi:hypothetical protein
MWSNFLRVVIFCLVSGNAFSVFALDQNAITTPFALSNQVPDLERAYKSKLVTLGNGVLIVVYGDAIEDNILHYVYDLKNDNERPARDVFIRTCDSANDDCSIAANWTSPLNISNTAVLTSINSDWNGDSNRTPYYGDSDNPHAFASGSHVVVTWVDNYCPGGAQRTVTYFDRNNREIPMRCVYAAHSTGNVGNPATWVVERLTDGSRDAKQDVSRGLGSGVWAITWQEDPLGLQPGEAEGPGEGASGAKVSRGTDIWYSYTSNVSTTAWSMPVRITDNQTGFGLKGTSNPVKDAAGNPVSPTLIETGDSGSSRANLAIVGGSSPPKTIVAYEETKGSSGLDQGKFLRYHTFNYNAPPTDLICNPMNYENCRTGCIVSNPAENARRARFVPQTNAGTSGLRWAFFWREGQDMQGGPADIVLRLGYNNFTASNLSPAVDYPACYTSVYNDAINLTNTPALNISSNTQTASAANLTDTTDTNNLENARAHRAVLRGDFLNVGYIYTPDWDVAENTNLENYNFYLRHYDATTNVWRAPVNLSNIWDSTINVKEPRLVGPPGNRAGCVDPQAPTDPRDCQNKNVVVAAWGTETNVSANTVSAENLDIFVTRTTDQAASFEPVVVLAGGDNIQGESQIRITPAGTDIYAVWTEQDTMGAINSMYAQITEQEIPPPAMSNLGSGGCSYNPKGKFDPMLPVLLLVSIIYLAGRFSLASRPCVKQGRRKE